MITAQDLRTEREVVKKQVDMHFERWSQARGALYAVEELLRAAEKREANATPQKFERELSIGHPTTNDPDQPAFDISSLDLKPDAERAVG